MFTVCRYLEGNGVRLDLETAAWYVGCAAEAAYTQYHLVGKQPIIEQQRLTEANEEIVAIGQKGEDDGTIQYQVQSQANSPVIVGEAVLCGTSPDHFCATDEQLQQR